MLDNETQSLNYVVVSFITPDRKKITDSLKIFKTVGEPYRVNTPSLDGYILSQNGMAVCRKNHQSEGLLLFRYK